MSTESFTFDLGDEVRIGTSGECGEVIGRAEYARAEPGYHIRYCRADGVATEQWWPESALEPLP